MLGNCFQHLPTFGINIDVTLLHAAAREITSRQPHHHPAAPPFLDSLFSLTRLACSKMLTNSRYRRETVATASSRVILFARHSTSGCQKSVRPTANPMKP